MPQGTPGTVEGTPFMPEGTPGRTKGTPFATEGIISTVKGRPFAAEIITATYVSGSKKTAPYRGKTTKEHKMPKNADWMPTRRHDQLAMAKNWSARLDHNL